jgi:hypothetical protein
MTTFDQDHFDNPVIDSNTKNSQKKIKKRYYRLCSMFCAKHWRHIAQSHMLLFVICFSSYLNLVITL